MLAFHSDSFVLPLPPGHRFPMAKYALLRQALLSGNEHIALSEAPEASAGELALAHTPDYIDAVLNGTLGEAQQREIGFPWTPRMAQRACRSVGATVAAARQALRDGVAVNLAGGTHHAYANKGSGFCVFNDTAVASRLMQAEWHRRHRAALRVLVVDLDVHQGNGTAAIFGDDDTVFTFSMHGARNFPVRKEQSDLDVELPDGCSDDQYLDGLRSSLAALQRRHTEQPWQLAFYLAGADPHEGDRLGRLKLTQAGMAERDDIVFSWLRERHIPVAVSMAGGYGHDVAVTVALHEQTVRLAARSWQAWQQTNAKESSR